MKKWLLATLFMVVTVPAFTAETPKAEAQDKPQVNEASKKADKEAKKAERAALREKVKAFRQAQKEKIKAFREKTRTEHEAFRKALQEKRKAFQDELKSEREAFLQANPDLKGFMEKHDRPRREKKDGKPEGKGKDKSAPDKEEKKQ